jgi:hypothetical protein
VSAPEQERQEQRSSFKASRNAKGEAQFEIKILEGETDEALEVLRAQAIREYKLLAAGLDAPQYVPPSDDPDVPF